MPSNMISYRWFAKAYGWTPAQVDELDAEMLTWLPAIENAAEDAADYKRRQQARVNGNR